MAFRFSRKGFNLWGLRSAGKPHPAAAPYLETATLLHESGERLIWKTTSLLCLLAQSRASSTCLEKCNLSKVQNKVTGCNKQSDIVTAFVYQIDTNRFGTNELQTQLLMPFNWFLFYSFSFLFAPAFKDLYVNSRHPSQSWYKSEGPQTLQVEFWKRRNKGKSYAATSCQKQPAWVVTEFTRTRGKVVMPKRCHH